MSVSGEHQCSVLHRGGDAIDKGGNYYDEGNETQDDVQDDGINDGRRAWPYERDDEEDDGEE